MTGLVLKVEDAPAVLGLVRDSTSLPDRSEVQLQGTMGARPFKVTLERARDQRLKLELRGVSIADNRPMLELLHHLVDKHAIKVKLDYLLGERRVELEFEEGAAPPVADQRERLKQPSRGPERGLGVR